MTAIVMLAACAGLLLLRRGPGARTRRWLRGLRDGSAGDGPVGREHDAGPHRRGGMPALWRPVPGPSTRTGGTTSRGTARGDAPEHSQRGLPTPVRLELIAAMLGSGLSVSRAVHTIAQVEGSPALRRVARLLDTGLDWDAAWEAGDPRPSSPRGWRAGAGMRGRPAPASGGDARGLRHLRESLEFAVRTGAPAASLLRAQAARLRRQRHREAEKRAAALGVRLMLPLGLCSLPAFICLGVVPVLIGLVPTLW